MGWFKKLKSKVFDDILGLDPNGGGIYGVARDVLGDKIADDILGFDPNGGGSVGFVNAVAPIALGAVAAPYIASGIGSLASGLGAGAEAGISAASLGELGINTADAVSSAAAASGMTPAAFSELAAGAGISPTELAGYVSNAGSEIATGGITGGAAGGLGGATGGFTGSDVIKYARQANSVRNLLGLGKDETSPQYNDLMKLLMAGGAGAGLANLLDGKETSSAPAQTPIPRYTMTREALPIDPNRRPGGPEQLYFKDTYTKLAAGGGISGLKSNEYKAGGRYLAGPGDGMSDNIKANIDGVQEARLADGEFVIPADVVSHIGNGSSNAGAKKLHKMMDRIRHARTGNPKQGKQIKAEKFLPA